MSLWSRRNAGFIIMEDGGTDGAGANAGDKIIFNGDGAGVASAAEHFLRYQDGDAENAPKFLPTGSGGGSDYARGLCVATDTGWVQHHREMIMQMLTQKFLSVAEVCGKVVWVTQQ